MSTARTRRDARRWPRHFLGLLREAHPDYVLVPTPRAELTECVRTGADGLRHSQTTIRIRGNYAHGFAVMLTSPLPCTRLRSPFVAGGRFDHNFLIADAFEHDLGRPLGHPDRPYGTHSCHHWRSNADDIVRGCTTNAERYLAPHYRTLFQRAAPELMALLEAAAAHLGELDTPAFAHAHTRAEFGFLDLSPKDLAGGGGPWFARAAPARHLDYIARNPELFRLERARFDAMLGLLDDLRRTVGG
jgi:hypothetical protein